MWQVLVGVLGGVLAALAGTWLGYVLSKRAADEQWVRQQAARQRDRVVDLVEALLISSSDGAVAFGRPDRERQAAAVLAVARHARLLIAHAGNVDADLARIIEQAEERFRKAATPKDNLDALTSMTVLAELWLADPSEFVGKNLSDFEPSA